MPGPARRRATVSTRRSDEHHGQTAARGVLGRQGASQGVGEPLGHREPETHSGPSRRVPQPLEGPEDRLLRGVGDSRAAVDDPHLHPFAERTGRDQDGASLPAMPDGVLDQVREHPLEQTRVGDHERQLLGDAQVDAGRRGQPRQRGRHDLVDVHRTQVRLDASRSAAGSCPAGWRPARPAGRRTPRWWPAGPPRPLRTIRRRSDRRLDTAALMLASGVRRSWDTAASSAVRIALPSASCRACRARSASRSRSSTDAICAAKAPSTRWSPASGGLPRSSRTSVSETGISASASSADGNGGEPTAATRRHGARSSGRSRSVAAAIPKVARSRSSRRLDPDLAAQHGARERAQGGRLGLGPCGLLGPPRRQVDDAGHGGREHHEDDQRQRVLRLADGEGVERGGEEVVEQQAAEHRGDQGRQQAAHESHSDREGEEEQQLAGQAEMVADLGQPDREEHRTEHREQPARHQAAAAQRPPTTSGRERNHRRARG